MAIVIRTVTVNAAFLQEIKEDNQQLRELLHATREFCTNCRGEPADPRTIAELFESLRDQLALHFTLEDAYGYFEDALAESPRLCEHAHLLRDQHATLFVAIRDLAEQADCLRYGRPSVRQLLALADAFLEFDRHLREHEEAEDELIMAAFEDDIGVGD
ncbi:MAG: hemerythrin domain-containing protein [Planctomycetia bacterium]|nr:hemerythrin domain-containing protein [Planctomycetia bacterium]